MKSAKIRFIYEMEVVPNDFNLTEDISADTLMACASNWADKYLAEGKIQSAFPPDEIIIEIQE